MRTQFSWERFSTTYWLFQNCDSHIDFDLYWIFMIFQFFLNFSQLQNPKKSLTFSKKLGFGNKSKISVKYFHSDNLKTKH